jgi:potassium efflux system protein
LLTARRDKAGREVAQAEALAKQWQEAVKERRRAEAERAAASAKRDQRATALQHPALHAVAEKNAEFAKRRADLATKIEGATAELDRTTSLRAQLTTEFTSVRSKVEAAGLTHAMGQLLRQKRENLPDVRRRQRAVAVRKTEISGVQVDVIELEDARDELANVDRLVNATLEDMDATVGDDERREIEVAVQDLLQTRRGLVDALLNDCNAYFTKLVDLDAEEQLLIKEVQKFAAYIDERVLWIQSTSLPHIGDVKELSEALAWIIDGRNWAGVGQSLGRSVLASPASAVVGLPVFLALAVGRRRLRSQLRSIGVSAAKPTAQTHLPTMRALLLSALIGVTWPALLAFLGWRLSPFLNVTDFAKAVGAGFTAVAVVFVTAELFRQILAPKGLAECHFGWPAGRVRLLRRHLLWLMLVGLPIVFVVSAVEWTGVDAWQNTLGRLAFVVGQLMLAIAGRRVLRPDSGVFKASAGRTGRLYRARHLWHVLGVGLPLLLAILATVGYYYTALQLAHRLLASVWLLLALIVADALALRWLLVSRRKLAMAQARQRRAAAQAEPREKGESTTADELAEPQLDLSAISIQTRNLLVAVGVVVGFLGLWFIWVDVLPALNILDQVHLWSIAEGQVTLADLALALLTLVVASIATKNLPGLLEIAVLQHLPLQPGERYAITTTARYVIIIVAVSLAASAVGVGWSKVQWLVAAMTVGLGFGLQEIFANFVSGLIILFERPIRMGDIVTVGNVTGRVSRIRTRATTIIDWDWKELVIPNKEFVTGHVVNWSLSDQVLRLVVRVGIAYGSDTRKARDILLRIAQDNTRVLAEPRAKAFFQEFGESSLNFELRAWVKDIDDWILARHELHQAIDDAFREAGIEIAFPQRDIHVRSIRDALPVIDEEAARTGGRNARDTARTRTRTPGAPGA